MRLFVTVSAGERAGVSRPILAISDQQVVAEMLRPLGRMIDACSPEASGHAAPSLTLPRRRKAARDTAPDGGPVLAQQV